MVLPMSRPQKPKDGVCCFRQKVPADLLAAMAPKREVLRSLRTKDPLEAKARHAEEHRKQALVWQSLRAVPGHIPHKTIMALVGEEYRQAGEMVWRGG